MYVAAIPPDGKNKNQKYNEPENFFNEEQDASNYAYFSMERMDKYGGPGSTPFEKTNEENEDENDGPFGPASYGGIVVRDPAGKIKLGKQDKEAKEKRRGPVYAGGGYTKSIKALKSPDSLCAIIYICVSAFLAQVPR